MTTDKLKQALIDYLSIALDGEDVVVRDATQRAAIELPCIAVEIANVERHSVALQGVQRCSIEITLRCHAGDDETAETTRWIDMIETSLNDPSEIKALLGDGIRMDFWDYQGGATSWEGSVLEVQFQAESLVTRV